MTMNPIKFLVGKVIPAFVLAVSLTHTAMAQEASDMRELRAANESFYKALSARDVNAMLKLWSYKTEIRHIGPRNESINVGLDAAMKNWERLFAAYPEFKIRCEQEYFRINGATAWVSVIEKAQWKDAAGETQTTSHFGTNIFEKQDGRWYLVYHHGSTIPR